MIFESLSHLVTVTTGLEGTERKLGKYSFYTRWFSFDECES